MSKWFEKNIFRFFNGSALACAFSLVELMVTLVVVAVITAAMVPVITKKIKSQEVVIGTGGKNSNNLEFNQDCSAWGLECALCFDDRCSLCTKVCESFEYVNTPDCTCQNCINKDEKCISCTSKSCNKCDIGYGLDSSTKTCKKCETNQYSDGTKPCQICPENHYCNGSALVMCPTDSYAPSGSTSCIACGDTYPNCATCNINECLTCKKQYKLKNDTCIIASGSQTFTKAGEHEFVVPEGIEELTVTLVSGGAGGGGGLSVAEIKDFTTAGAHSWTIPLAIRGKGVVFSSVGGGGGNGWYLSGWSSSKLTEPGYGGALYNVSFTMPNQNNITVYVGAAGANVTTNGCNCSVSGSKGVVVCGGGGGGATYFAGYTSSAYLAPGGGGGNAYFSSVYPWVSGCTGEGVGGGAGSSHGAGYANNIFTAANVGYSRGHAREPGAMRVSYTNKYSGTGGGAGHIVPKQKISVSEGQILIITVGNGGAGGAVGASGVGAHSSMISKIVNTDGITLLSSAPSITSMGATGGVPNSATVGIRGDINTGVNTTVITMDGFSNTNGGAISGLKGGNGGATTIEGLQTLCSAGAGGSGIDVAGFDAIGFGGCGGGGGGAGAKGGAGAPGYVKISWGEE